MTAVVRIKRAVRSNEEEQLHRSIVARLEAEGDSDRAYWFHPANGGKRSKAAGGRLKAMGVRRGTPDLCFVLPTGHVAFMELKSLTGKLTAEQDEFVSWCQERNIPCPVVSDIDNAVLILRGWRVFKTKVVG